MTTDRHYLVHGLVVASPVELPIPAIEARGADVAYRVGEEAGPRPEAHHTRADDPDDPRVVERWDEAGLVVEFPDRASFAVHTDEVVLLADLEGDPDLVAHLLLDHVLPRVVALRGDLMLHASGAVGPSGRAHLLLGPTGIGKSTLATALAGHRWPLLDDDGIRVVDRDGVPHAVPGYAGVRLLPDSADAVLPGRGAGRPLLAGHPKRRYPVDGRLLMADEPSPIAAVYVMERSEAIGPRAKPVGLGAAVAALTEHGFHLADEPERITRQAFERAGALATSSPVFHLRCPHGLASLDAVVGLLARLDTEAGGNG